MTTKSECPSRSRLAEEVHNQPLSTPPKRRHGERQYHQSSYTVGWWLFNCCSERRSCASQNSHEALQNDGSPHCCGAGIPSRLAMTRNVQPRRTTPGPNSRRGSWGRCGPRQVSSRLRVHNALSLASSQGGRKHKRSAVYQVSVLIKDDKRAVDTFCQRRANWRVFLTYSTCADKEDNTKWEK
ncbi:hypothetical protein N657DRAFT_228551 [Parathielavia appendiculata]|uniref:Uncharacterized protein n=1 Tax=Parathielavia appendiculata TaxID=2587402 RepID=A0AAN6U7Q7_9PEZI|nr:hypothetical protein N657DRAFT_228551 [Parathielavia appendiculata]